MAWINATPARLRDEQSDVMDTRITIECNSVVPSVHGGRRNPRTAFPLVLQHVSSQRLTWRPRHAPASDSYPVRLGELQDEAGPRTIFPINGDIVDHCTWDSASPRLSGNSVRTI